jgi:putative heme uptake system protein
VLLWDAPDMDRNLAEVLGRRASPDLRPRMDAIARWWAERSDGTDRVEACVFANVAPGQEEQLTRWVANLRQWGWSVFVRPRRRRGEAVTDELLRHLERRLRQGHLVEVAVASHDLTEVGPVLRRGAAEGVRTIVIGFPERLEPGMQPPVDGPLLDLEDIPGAFAAPLPRTNLVGLPGAGRWFEPLAPLRPRPAPARTGMTDRPVLLDGHEPSHGPAPVALDRDAVVDLIADAVAASGAGGLTLQAAGDLLRARFPGFTLAAAGFGSVRDLLDELHLRAGLLVDRLDGGHLLRPSAVGWPPAAPVGTTPDPVSVPSPARDDPGGDDPGGDGEVIDLRDGATSTARTGANPIYRMFGYRPDATP